MRAIDTDTRFQKLQARILLPSWYSEALETEKAKIMASYKRALADKMAELLEPYIECEVNADFDPNIDHGEFLYGTLYVRKKDLDE